MGNTDVGSLPDLTDDLDRAEHDLREHGICAVADVLPGAALDRARNDLNAAAAADWSAGRGSGAFLLDPDDTNQRVWNLLGRSPAFIELAEHPTVSMTGENCAVARGSAWSADAHLPDFTWLYRLTSLNGYPT